MKKMLNYLALLNLLDGFITALGLHFNVIEESNPLMRDLYDLHPFIFLFLKITFSGLLIILSIFISAESRIKLLAAGASIVYSIVCLQHSVWIFSLIVNRIH
ncbi:DUF5658 family protein [Cytobacillus pseudoceanisediminis]|uniref:DUF5658 domain-containing protein n=2 Tax=Cytobacillus TaxID=2675230 RepID=A0ABX3CZX7_9BACI|nr:MULTISPECIES: DUF5658 family protein [Cytobacillus]OHX50443.1 hypothetical protein BBV17_08265 [Cytobacillus oceanisediminis]QOK27188.1 hypothetical protein IIE26_00415 [Cytobacillus oceanisediminis]